MRFATTIRNLKRRANGCSGASLIGAAAVMLPLLTIFASFFQPTNENWESITKYILYDSVLDTVKLVLLSVFFSVAVGVGLAWLVSAYDFPFRRFFRFALLLPLAIPPYIGAYTYSSMLSYTGAVQTWMRNDLGILPDPFWFDVMSLRGAVTVFTLFLYPYVYLIARTFLERQSGALIENARLLGGTPARIFFRIVLPVARPAIIGGSALVAFEVLSDYGVTSYFGLSSVSVAIFQVWFGMYDMDSAIRLAALLMSFVVIFLFAERILRGRKRYAIESGRSKPIVPRKLRGLSSALPLSVCWLVFGGGFLIPVVQLIVWAVWSYREIWSPAFYELTVNTLAIALIATAFIMLLSAVVAQVCRNGSAWGAALLSKTVTAGYSIPGAVLAMGVLVLFVGADRVLAKLYAVLGVGSQGALVLSMSLGMLAFGYVVRFMATGYNAVEAGYEKIGHSYSEASRLLGCSRTRTFFKVELPLLRGALVAGSVLTFVEIVKELPLTLLLRPYNFGTLATKAYQYASDEKIHEASLPSLFIIGISLVSVLLIHNLGKKMES